MEDNEKYYMMDENPDNDVLTNLSVWGTIKMIFVVAGLFVFGCCLALFYWITKPFNK